MSAIGAQRPILISDAKTGEIISIEEHDQIVLQLLNYVQKETNAYFNEHKNMLSELLVDYTGTPKAAEYARQKSIKFATRTDILAQSRVEKLIQQKLIGEVSSWVKNPNPRKQEPTFVPKIDLGAVDKQMAVLSYDKNTLELSLIWKVWDRELMIMFQLPDYLHSRKISKISLPRVQISKKTGNIIYLFAVEEIPAQRAKSKQKAGVDLGRTEPFTLAILTENNRRIADYHASGRVRALNKRRERILTEKKHILAKADAYVALGIDDAVLRTESQRKANKAKILGQEVAKQLAADLTKKLKKHEIDVLNIEDLRWATGARYGSKWNHSQQQEAITHSVAREGIMTKKINPRNTSQTCHLCGSTVTHNSKTRVAKCSSCKEKFDRDFNAAINIAANINNKSHRFPNQQSRIGDDCSVALATQIIDRTDQNSIIKPPITTLAT